MNKMLIVNEESFDYKDSNTLERIVLFEKYNPLLSMVLLTDFNEWSYPLPDQESLLDSINNLNNQKVLGELGCKSILPQEINLANVSHEIKQITYIDNKIYGILEILDTPAGEILKEISKMYKLKMNIRAIGFVLDNQTVFTDIVTWDIESEKKETK